MSIKLQDITTSTNLDMTDKVLVSDGTSEHLVTVETLLGRMSTLFQGMQGGTSLTVSDNQMHKIALVNDGVEVPSGDSGMEISSGGIKVSEAGSYKIAANAYLNPADNTHSNGIYIFYGTTFTDGPSADTGATELCGVFDCRNSASIVQVTGIVTNVAANTIFWIIGRASNSANCVFSASWLLVERLA